MKIIKTASGKKTIKISKKEWTSIGKKAGWMDAEVDASEQYLNLYENIFNSSLERGTKETMAKQVALESVLSTLLNKLSSDVNALLLYGEDSELDSHPVQNENPEGYVKELENHVQDLQDKLSLVKDVSAKMANNLDGARKAFDQIDPNLKLINDFDRRFKRD